MDDFLRTVTNEKEYLVYQKTFQNIYETLVASATKYPDKVAIIDDNEEITYKQLQHKVDQLACFLQKEFKVKKGDRVGLLFVNNIQFCISFYAVIKFGGIAVMVNTKLQSNEIEYVLKDTQTKMLIMNARWWNKVEDIVDTVGIEKVIFDKSVSYTTSSLLTNDLQTILNESLSNIEYIDTETYKDLSQTAVIMHTSGTTGAPKGVMISHRNILEAAYGYEEVLGLDETALTVLSVPIFHILGLSCVTTLFIYISGTIVLSDFYNTEVVLSKITKYKATHFHSVPAVYIKMTRGYKSMYNLSSLKIAVCGGAKIDQSDVLAFCNLAPNASFRLAYGMTETAGSGVLSPEHMHPGKPVPNVAVDIVDSQMNIVPTGETGQVIFKGPTVVQGYWNGQYIKDGHLHSGDMAHVDKDGYIYVTDRIKDIINRGGEKIFPSVLEELLSKYPGIAQSAVFGISDDIYGEIPAAVVVVEEGMEVDISKVSDYMIKNVAKYEMPQVIEIWESLPTTSNGKVQKLKLKEHFDSIRNGGL